MKNEACKPSHAWRSNGIAAQILECDPDELLAMARRVPSILANIIKRHPVEMSSLLRTDNGLSTEDMDHFLGQDLVRGAAIKTSACRNHSARRNVDELLQFCWWNLPGQTQSISAPD